MFHRATAARAVIAFLATLLPALAHAEDIDTEHIFGFMIGTDVGDAGEREFQSQTTGRFSKGSGNYRAFNQEFELEIVPANNFRIEMGSEFAWHDIRGVNGLDDRNQLSWQGLSLDLRYRFLERQTAPFGLTFSLDSHADRIDDISAASVRSYGTDMTLVFDRELIPGVLVAALNLIYQPEWTRFFASGLAERESTIGAAMGVMAQLRPGFLLGGEARYFRKYEGIGLDDFAGQALYVGPTAYFQLSDTSRLTLSWSSQVWGQTAASTAALDLVNFERHQARIVFGANF
jgi:hypothetical protein